MVNDNIDQNAETTSKPHLQHKLAYTLKDFVELTSISRSQAYVEIRNGRLCATKIGSRTVFLHEDVMSWLKALAKSSHRR